ncbi:hypothetical protein OIV83_004877 [Microbotryomycetes sp. JL201]|nr:hypothetical protein OIV83_004877 [Microbotryomycetes sp. JL201]
MTAAAVCAVAATSESGSGIDSLNFTVPPAHYYSSASFRGLSKEGKVSNYHASGHTTVLPGVHDFIRLVPPTPLAHGALFSDKPLQAEEWMAEIAFRVHGPAVHGLADLADDGTPVRAHKGGRGLALWYTKHANPGPITISSDPKVATQNPPPTTPQSPTDPTDDDVSLFGSKTAFDGLGIVFDTMPTQPLYRRSDSRNWEFAEDSHHGLSTSGGVVSGLLDDGTGKWLEPDNRKMSATDEAAYLEKAIGECEAAFRNANGLIWARVDLDLSPHTTLAKAGRDYAHNCFIMPGVSLTPGHHLGVSALASGYTEPDAVDIYALDVFEVVSSSDDYDDMDEPPESLAAILEGTSGDVTETLTHEIFISQAKMMDAIDGLSRKIDLLGRLVRAPLTAKAFSSSGGDDPQAKTSPHLRIESRLDNIESALRSIRSTSPIGGGDTAAPAAREDREVLKHLLQQSERLLAEVTAFGRKLDTANGQSLASLATLSTRSTEILGFLRRAQDNVERAAKGKHNVWIWLGGVAAVVAMLGAFLGRRRHAGGGWNDKKSF